MKRWSRISFRISANPVRKWISPKKANRINRHFLVSIETEGCYLYLQGDDQMPEKDMIMIAYCAF